MVNIRNEIQGGIGRRCEELMTLMIDIAKENYLTGKSQWAINEYSSYLVDESLNLQFRVAFLRPSEQEDIYNSFFKGRNKNDN